MPHVRRFLPANTSGLVVLRPCRWIMTRPCVCVGGGEREGGVWG
jgi:hypothetical protein